MSYSMAWQNQTPAARAKDDGAEKVDVYIRISDIQLVELVLNGEETAFEQIFDRHKKLAAMIAARYFRRPEQIEEIIQVCFAKVYFELRNFRGAHDRSLASWVGKITTNACLDALRNQNRKPENLICELSEEESDALLAGAPHDKSTEKFLVERDLAEKLLSRLGAEDRAILQMLYVEEMSVSEIAEVMGWTQSRIKLRAWRARNGLRKILRKFL